MLSYADDTTFFSQHLDLHTDAIQLQDSINILEQWLHSNRMKVSPSKPTLTSITPRANEYKLQPTIALTNAPIVYNQHGQLGVTYDKSMSLIPHTDNINTQAKTDLEVLGALIKTLFSQSKEDIKMEYKQHIMPILT